MGKKEKNKNVIKGSKINVGGNLHLGDIVNINELSAAPKEEEEAEVPPISSTLIENIRQLIVDNKVKESLEQLLIHTKAHDQDLYNMVVLHAQRWNKLKNDQAKGVIEQSDASVISNRIVNNLLGILDDLERLKS